VTAGYVRGLDLHLDVGEGRGRGRALETALRDAVRSGRLGPGTRLPGTRSLAADLGLSRGTVVQAFGQLVAEGWLVGVAGSGTVVGAVPAGSVPPEPDARPAAVGTRPGIDLRPGRPDLSAFPRTPWARAVRRALAGSTASLDYADPAGLPVLRAAVAEHVARTRGVRASPDAVVVTAGFTQALALLARVAHRLGIRLAGVEDPGFARHRDVLGAAGLTPVPLPVDDAGADPDALPDGPALALLTPAHQHPCGVVLAPARRAAMGCRGVHPSCSRARRLAAPRAHGRRGASETGGAGAPTDAQNAGTQSRAAAGSSSQTFTAPDGHSSAATAAAAASSTCRKLVTSPSATRLRPPTPPAPPAAVPRAARASAARSPSGANQVSGP